MEAGVGLGGVGLLELTGFSYRATIYEDIVGRECLGYIYGRDVFSLLIIEEYVLMLGITHYTGLAFDRNAGV